MTLTLAAMTVPGTAMDTLAALDSLCSGSQSNTEYKGCLRQRYLTVDRELNRVWKRVITEIRRRDYPERAQRKKWEARLREAQRNWVRFKDIDCNKAVLFEWWGGTGAGGAVSLCLIRHTMLRTEDLKERYFPDENSREPIGVAADTSGEFVGADGQTAAENGPDLGLDQLETLEKLE